jgi:hypothetical protein
MGHRGDGDGEQGREPEGDAQGGISRRLPVPLAGDVAAPGPRPGSRWDQASAAFVTHVIASLQREETQRDRRLLAPQIASARYARTSAIPDERSRRLFA